MDNIQEESKKMEWNLFKAEHSWWIFNVSFVMLSPHVYDVHKFSLYSSNVPGLKWIWIVKNMENAQSKKVTRRRLLTEKTDDCQHYLLMSPRFDSWWVHKVLECRRKIACQTFCKTICWIVNSKQLELETLKTFECMFKKDWAEQLNWIGFCLQRLDLACLFALPGQQCLLV